MDTIHLPGSIPGLLRRGSPILAELDGSPREGTVVLTHPNGGGMVHFGVLIVLPFSGLGISLDLSDATGRAHAAWWLADRWGKERAAHDGLSVLGRGWQLGSGAWGRWVLPSGPFHVLADDVDSNVVCVPALAGLNPEDPSLLPDGSRWVDAEALRLVCLHVAGMEAQK